MLCTFAAQQAQIIPFPRPIVRVEGEPGARRTAVDGLGEILRQCYEQWKLPGELNAPWAAPSRQIEVPPLEP